MKAAQRLRSAAGPVRASAAICTGIGRHEEKRTGNVKGGEVAPVDRLRRGKAGRRQSVSGASSGRGVGSHPARHNGSDAVDQLLRGHCSPSPPLPALLGTSPRMVEGCHQRRVIPDAPLVERRRWDDTGRVQGEVGNSGGRTGDGGGGSSSSTGSGIQRCEDALGSAITTTATIRVPTTSTSIVRVRSRCTAGTEAQGCARRRRRGSSSSSGRATDPASTIRLARSLGRGLSLLGQPGR